MADRRMIHNSSMVFLPIDILFNILIRLPIISLLQLKSVCKSWYFLITSREFANHHLRRNSHSSDRLLVFSGEFESLYSVNLDTLESPAVKVPFSQASERYSRKKIVGSCNGLLLCICDETFNFEGLLLNISSFPYKKIPKLDLPLNCLYINYGFGYDCGLDDYKVIRIVHFLSCDSIFFRNSMEIMVYSLKANSWKLVKNNFPIFWTPKSQYGLLVKNNLLHWLFPCSSNLGLYRIACLDVSSEEWSEIPMVDQIYVLKKPVELGVLDECLCLLIGDSRKPAMGLKMWIMKEYGVKDSWMNLFDYTDWSVIKSLCIPPIAYSQDGTEILLKRDESSTVFWYNVRQKRLAVAEIHGLLHNRGLSTCIRTLIRPCRNDQISDETFNPMSQGTNSADIISLLT